MNTETENKNKFSLKRFLPSIRRKKRKESDIKLNYIKCTKTELVTAIMMAYEKQDSMRPTKGEPR